MNIQRETSGHIAAIVTILIWGTTFISTKVLLADFSPMEILFYRFLMGFIALILVRPNMIPFRNWRQELLFAGAGLFGVTLYFLLENIALTYTYASNVGMIVTDDHCGFGPFSARRRKTASDFFDWICLGTDRAFIDYV
ncbi:putative inner membrane transporter YhbE [Bacillus subtilis]|nr:putative inner membrane transporter YhbE [Bacillus subtilis]